MAIQNTGFRFLTTFLVWLFSIVAIFLALVTVIDPNRHFGGHWFPNTRVAARSDKIRLFESFHERGPVTGLILGSSRSMIVPPEELDSLTGKRFFNAAVYNAFPEDDLAMYRTLVKRGAKPEILLVGIDDDHLDDARPYDQEMEANYAFRAEIDDSIRGPAGFILHRIDHYKRSLSFIMVSNMISSAQVMISHTPPAFTWAPDGERVVRRNAEGDGEGYLTLLRNMKQLSQRRESMLETLIREAGSQGAKVTVFMTPYRPVILDMIRQDPQAWQHHLLAVDYLLSLPSRYAVRVADYTDEASFGGDPNDWLDGVHVAPANGARLARQVIHDGL